MESNHPIPPSPPLSQPETTTADGLGPEGSLTSPQLTLIHQLLRDKDRLLKDKDEMLRSKSEFWQDSYENLKRRDDVVDELRNKLEELRQSVKGHDEEIENQRSKIRHLQEKYSSAKAKNRRLAKAFNQYMDQYGPEEDDDDNDNKSVTGCKDKAQEEDSEDEIDLHDEELDTQRKQLQELFPINIKPRSDADAEPARKRQRLSSVEPQAPVDVPALLAGASAKLQALQEQSMEFHDDTRSEEAFPSTPSNLKRKQKALISAQAGDPIEDRHNTSDLAWSPSLRPDLAPSPARQDTLQMTQKYAKIMDPPSATMTKLLDDFLTPWRFTMRPLVHVTTTDEFTDYDLRSLSKEVMESIHATFRMLKVRHEDGKRRLRPTAMSLAHCCHGWISGSTSRSSWTIDHPKQFACRSCLKAERACFTWQGYGRWDILPLPPSARSPSATPTDAGYYIYQGQDSCETFFHLYKQTYVEKWEAKKRLGQQG